MIPRRRLSIGSNPTEASKPLPIWRGTGISNPFPSTRESGELSVHKRRRNRTHSVKAGGTHDSARPNRVRQSPAPLGGGLVKTEWFKRYRDDDKLERFDRIVQSWDTANKATELSDYSVCTTWGVKGKHLFLIGLFRRRLEYPALKRAVREQQDLAMTPAGSPLGPQVTRRRNSSSRVS